MEKLLAFKKWGYYGLVLCLSLLNYTQVHAQCPADAGAIEITGTGATSADICAGDGMGDPIDVTVTGAPVGTNSGWVITDNVTGTILALPPAPPFDLDGAGAGVCDIWYIRYEAGLTGLMTGANVADLAGCFDLSNAISVNRFQPEAGAISITGSGATEIDICAGDGTGDPIDVTVAAGSVGANSGWVITDNTTGEILALPPAPPFDLDGAGAGVCDIWYIRYDGTLTGLATGANVADLDGCFDLSNAITVNRFQPEAGAISVTGTGATEVDICAGDGMGDPIDVTVAAGSAGANSGWVITDNTTGTILALPAGPPFDLDPAGPGVCDIWYVRYDGALTGLQTGENVADLEGCFDLSNPITVNRYQPEAAAISIAGTGGSTVIGICAGDGMADPIDVVVEAGSMGPESGWIITDNATGTILALPPGPPFDLDGAGAGICDIWYVRYGGTLSGLETGQNVADLDGCFDLSNPISVNRFQPEAGAIEVAGTGETEVVICVDGVGDPLDIALIGSAQGQNSAWVITDNTTGTILALPPGPPFDLDGAGPGVCDIWYMRYDSSLFNLEVGENVDDLIGCFDLSNPVSVIRQEAEAGTLALPDGSTAVSICAGDGTGDPLEVIAEGQSEYLSYRYVITDNSADSTILAISDSNIIDLEGAGAGICLIWGWSYTGLDPEDFIGQPAANLLLEDCSDISEGFIEVTRLTGADCEVLAIEDQAVLSFEMAPNPATDFVEIRLAQTSELEVVVYDLAGRQLRVEQFDNAQQARLDVNGLPTGTYLLRMVDRSTGSTATSRLIKR